MYVTAQEYEALSLTHAVPAAELESALQAAERAVYKRQAVWRLHLLRAGQRGAVV